MSAVKGTDKRTQRARQTRRKIVEAARELFIEHGYGATSLQDIADQSGLAVQTIYYVFGNKRQLLKELVDTTIGGDDAPVATMDRPWFREALDTENASEQLQRHVHGTRHILDRVAPITPLIEGASATDPAVAELWPQQQNPRFTVQSAAAQALVTKPGARDDVSADEAADVLFGLLSPQLYLVFVRDRGWPPERWEDWAYQTLHHQLCTSVAS